MIDKNLIGIYELREELSQKLNLPNTNSLVTVSFLVKSFGGNDGFFKKLIIDDWDSIIFNNEFNLNHLNFDSCNLLKQEVIILTDKTIEDYKAMKFQSFSELSNFYEDYYARYQEEFWQYSEYILFFPKNDILVLILDLGIIYILDLKMLNSKRPDDFK
ncbi:MAG: hypothetical protein R2774_01485 [Saprospiraceae bacterium]